MFATLRLHDILAYSFTATPIQMVKRKNKNVTKHIEELFMMATKFEHFANIHNFLR